MMASLRVAFAVAAVLAPLAALLSPSCHAFTSPNQQRLIVQPQSHTLTSPLLTSSTTIFTRSGDIEDEKSAACRHHEASSPIDSSSTSSRRSFIIVAGAALFSTSVVGEADAAADCFTDCQKECKIIAPKDPEYCQSSCQEYCAQSDRTDGLSGSVSSTGGETGILGTTTVVKGEDKPPGIKIPGLDFSSDKGRKLLGY
mmetsp:Transcript_8282/g.20352  ORF Transcript_8282/g.20352 Transcript_8282/m.20352 type:complete len:199 (+) Transcript_8282:76-672(+)